MFDLKKEVEAVLAGSQGLLIASGAKVTPFEDAKPIDQIRWFKGQMQKIEDEHKPVPKPRKTAAPATASK